MVEGYTGRAPMSDIEMEDLGNSASHPGVGDSIRQSQLRAHRSARRRSRRSQVDGKEPSKLEVYVQQGSSVTVERIDSLRKKLKRFYVTPCDKWNSNPRKFPFKLVLQLLKVLVVTLQLSAFAADRSSFTTFEQRTKTTFSQMFLKDWGPENYAVYSQEDLYSHINYVLYQYYRFSDVTLSTFQTTPNDEVRMNSRYYSKATLDPIKKTYNVDSHVESHHDLSINKSIGENCTESSSFDCYDIRKYLDDIQQPIDLARLTEVKLNFTVKGINVKEPKYTFSQPVADVECVQFRLMISYDNAGGNGQILIKLHTLFDMRKCNNNPSDQVLEESIHRSNTAAEGAITAFDVFVLLICTVSFTLALRSTIQRWQRMRNAKAVFEEHYGYRMTIPEMMDFLSMWYIQYMISDALVAVGTVLKIYFRFGDVVWEETFDNNVIYNSVAIALGIASLAQWIGLIRYLVFFNRYYILILTISNAAPALLRFLVCGMTIYLGFVFSGWVILGPYNPKFATITNTAETLFGLMSGNDMYITMSIISQEEQPLIHGFSIVYLCVYIILFIFAIANLFIAVITDSYECVKNGECFKKSFLKHFVDDTLVVKGSTADKNLRVYDELTEDEVDEQYGMLSPLLCCLDRCVHHSVNVTKSQEEEEVDTTSVTAEKTED